MSKIDYQALREAAERAIPAMERLLMLPSVSTEVSSACGMYQLVTVPDSFLGFCANCKATCPDG